MFAAAGAGGVGLHAVGVRRDEQAMDVLHLPAVVHQLDGQPIEQRLIARLRAAQAEVEHVVDERRAEVAQPDVVDGHAGGERVLAVGDPAGEGQPAAGARAAAARSPSGG